MNSFINHLRSILHKEVSVPNRSTLYWPLYGPQLLFLPLHTLTEESSCFRLVHKQVEVSFGDADDGACAEHKPLTNRRSQLQHLVAGVADCVFWLSSPVAVYSESRSPYERTPKSSAGLLSFVSRINIRELQIYTNITKILKFKPIMIHS